jgi:hypothetical protein
MNDLTMLSNNPVRVSLPSRKHKLVLVFSAALPVPFVAANIRTLAKLVQAVAIQSTINLDGTYVIPATIDIDGLSLTPTMIGRLPYVIRMFEILHFGYMAQWETFYQAVTTNQLLCHEDTSITRQLLFYSRVSTVDRGPMWMLT